MNCSSVPDKRLISLVVGLLWGGGGGGFLLGLPNEQRFPLGDNGEAGGWLPGLKFPWIAIASGLDDLPVAFKCFSVSSGVMTTWYCEFSASRTGDGLFGPCLSAAEAAVDLKEGGTIGG